ncbi:MAG: CoA pyrophosphatase [Bacteroidota bacterium]|jgi:8-oxo-dGTP pyrophosphatase MutT (NUDIX family)
MMLTRERIKQALLEYRRVEISREQYLDFSRAAILIPLFPVNDELSVLLTVRTHEVDTHKGQISFPGGLRDETDEDAVHTALRETEEELGINPNNIEILGTLDDLSTPTGFIITPVVGHFRTKPALMLNTSEVAETFSVPLSFFVEEKNGRWEMRNRGDSQMKVWFYQYGKYLIWGATAAIMKNLLKLATAENT